MTYLGILNFEKYHFKMAKKLKMAAKHECQFSSTLFETLDLKTSIHKKNIVEITLIFLRLRIMQFKIESIYKMAILRLSIRLLEHCIFAIFSRKILDSYRRLYG
jgi:hypothetical protein